MNIHAQATHIICDFFCIMSTSTRNEEEDELPTSRLYQAFIVQSRMRPPPPPPLSIITSRGGDGVTTAASYVQEPPSPPSFTAYQIDDIDDDRYHIASHHDAASKEDVDTQPPSPILVDDIVVPPPQPQLPSSMPDLEPLSPEPTRKVSNRPPIQTQPSSRQTPTISIDVQQRHPSVVPSSSRMTEIQIKRDLTQIYNLVSNVKLLLEPYGGGGGGNDGSGENSLSLVQPDVSDYTFVLDFKSTHRQLTRAMSLLDHIKSDRNI